ncbi:inositol monophosphatase [Streptomyces sp. CB01881]|uniref:inositol monophosphatase family protein n=1 Tax=Streptomyces sp. CB01881 TaxID=2078691 RepID=UPI000CDC7C25|nr:inositol monophosphatase [Streptomyces sp. CB01881]AUY53036.1 inositol monophosphatase [Streptomyces sp. CB01881]TYC70751.1 inositol monophosphatase [Streptomyces sp. CB01881]
MNPRPKTDPGGTGGTGSPGFEAECQAAVDIAEEAGGLLRSRFRRAFRIHPKGEDGDVVTELDLLAEELVTRRLAERFPSDRIVAEEGGGTGPGAGGGGGPSGRTWLVDPLDGSNNVVVGLPVYVVGIALCVGDEPVLGVVHDPVTGRTWRAVRGGGAFGPRGRLRRPSGPPAPAGPVLAWTQGHGVPAGDPVCRALKEGLEAGSRRLLQLWAPLLTWSMLARGDIDGFVGYRAEEIDLPAGCLLAAEAGLEIRRLDGGRFSGRIGQPDTARSFVAGRPEVLPHLLDLVARAAKPDDGFGP